MTKRIAHQLRGGRRTEAPSRFLFVDTETHWYCLICGTYAPLPDSDTILECPKDSKHDRFEAKLFLGEALFWRREHSRQPELETWHDFTTADEFWNIVDSHAEPKQLMCVFAFNFGFDLQALGGFHLMREKGWTLGARPIVDNPPFIAKARKNSTTILLLDWYNYFRGSLSQVGQFVGIPKLTMPKENASEKEWRVYCRQDVRVLHAAVKGFIAFLAEYDLGTFSHTLAGQALTAFRHRFMEHEIFIHDTDKAVQVERAGYMGGRVEMFRRNILPPRTYTYLDINSAYPAVMATGVYPVAYRGIENEPSVEHLGRRLGDSLCMATVVLRTPLPLYPVRDEGRLIFPIGEFQTTLASPELRIALARGHIRSVSVATYYDGEPIFASWVREIYALRSKAKKSGDEFYDEMLKRMMNSLYGKFGQRNYEWSVIDDHNEGPDHVWKEYDRRTGRVHTLRRLGGVLQVRRSESEGFNSFVAIAAHVTSAARALLLSYIETAGWGHVYYVDSDSLVVDASGLLRLRDSIDETVLGSLKVVAQSRKVRLGAPKNYDFGDIHRHKGRKNNARQLPHERYAQDQFVSLQGSLRLGWQGGPLLRRVVKHDTFSSKKGVLHDDDTISPFEFFRLSREVRVSSSLRVSRSRKER